MGKVKNKTFAQRAEAITNKYKRRLGKKLDGNDSISRESMELELDALQQEQEQYKTDNGLNEQPNPVFRGGGKLPQYQGIGRSQIIGGGLNQDGVIDYGQELGLSPFIDPEQALIFNEKFTEPDTTEEDMIFALNNKNFTLPKRNNTLPVNAAQQNLEPELYSPDFDYVGAGATLASGIANYLNTPDKLDKIKTQRIRGENIDLSSERVNARSRANRLRNVSKRTARGVASNAADYTNRAISGEVAASRLEGEQIASSLTREKTTNAQTINRIREINARNKLAADAQNVNIQRINQGIDQEKGQAVTDTFSGLAKNYAGYRSQQDLYNALQLQSPYYSIYKDPETGKPIISLDENKKRRD